MHHFPEHFPTRRQPDFDLARCLDHMIIGDDVTVRRKNDAGTGTALPREQAGSTPARLSSPRAVAGGNNLHHRRVDPRGQRFQDWLKAASGIAD